MTNNKSFIIFLMIATILVFGVIVEKTRTDMTPQETKETIDASSIKNKIQKAGIVPHDAKYWKEL